MPSSGPAPAATWRRNTARQPAASRLLVARLDLRQLFGRRRALATRAAEEGARYEAMNEKQLAREVQAIEKQMLDLAHILEFGKTAKARDRLSVLKKRAFSIELHSE